MTRYRGLARTVAITITTGGLVALAAAPASAHVTVNPPTTTGGGYSQLTFRAPNEQAKADFTKLTIHLPADHSLGYVGTRTLDGWTTTTTTAKLPKPITTDDGTVTEYTDSITWTATGKGIAPEQYQNFDVSTGALPDSGTMTFPADQSYSDGSVVKWDETAKAGADEPKHPAPVLTLTAATATEAASDSGQETNTSASSHDHSDGVARGLSIAAIAVAILGAGAAVVASRHKSS